MATCVTMYTNGGRFDGVLYPISFWDPSFPDVDASDQESTEYCYQDLTPVGTGFTGRYVMLSQGEHNDLLVNTVDAVTATTAFTFGFGAIILLGAISYKIRIAKNTIKLA